MSDVWFYVPSGVAVACDMEVPEWEAFRVAALGAEAVRIQRADFHAGLPELTCSLADGRDVWLVVTGFATFHVEEGRRITIYSEPGVPERQWRLFLRGSAFNALCLQRDILLLHASVVAAEDGAVAFCGPSGAGKSTLAASLLQDGFDLVCDDLGRVDVGETVLVHPSTPRLRLWGEMLPVAGARKEELVHVLDGRDKYLVPVPGVVTASLPLRAVFLLEWGEPDVRRLSGLEGLKRFVGEATFRPLMVEAMGRTGRHWEQCLRLLARVPLLVLRRPNDVSRLDAAPRLVRRVLAEMKGD